MPHANRLRIPYSVSVETGRHTATMCLLHPVPERSAAPAAAQSGECVFVAGGVRVGGRVHAHVCRTGDSSSVRIMARLYTALYITPTRTHPNDEFMLPFPVTRPGQPRAAAARGTSRRRRCPTSARGRALSSPRPRPVQPAALRGRRASRAPRGSSRPPAQTRGWQRAPSRAAPARRECRLRPAPHPLRPRGATARRERRRRRCGRRRERAACAEAARGAAAAGPPWLCAAAAS
mmetsp:Transcript_13807/g.44862  ORF Transcript_13807/g.44862 Transcript_13807/m.44862 type:complete len:234 (-) Transcript_13807:352-1053(-)